MNMSKMDMINEGMEDWMEIQKIRAMVKSTALEHRQAGSTNPAVIKEARRRAKAVGLSYWPALVMDWNRKHVDIKAYIRADEIVSAKSGSRYGQMMPDGTRSNGGWDSYNRYGVSADFVASAWFAAGCKLGDKFDIQIRTGVVGKKYMSTRQTADYCRGLKWLRCRNMQHNFSVKATVAIGRLSPEFRVLATQDLCLSRHQHRIADLRWDVVKGGQEFLAKFTGKDRVYARAILGLGFGIIRDGDICDTEPTGIGNASALIGIPCPVETLCALVDFMRKHCGYIDYDANLAIMVGHLIRASRGKAMYHHTVCEFIGNESYAIQNLANKLMSLVSSSCYVNNCRDWYCGSFIAIMNLPGADIDHLLSCVNALAMVVDQPNGLNMCRMPADITALLADAYILDPQLVHGLSNVCTEASGRFVEMSDCAPIIEAMTLYREGKTRKALTHSCMPKFAIINKDFGFNLSFSDQALFDGVNAKAINAIAKAYGWDIVRRHATDTISFTNALGIEAIGVIADELDSSLVAPLDPHVETIHSFVNMYMPNFVANPLSQQWNQFFKKHRSALRYAGHVTSETVMPVSIEAFIKDMARHKYRRGAEASIELLELATRLEMSNKAFERYLDYIKRTPTKMAEMLPFVRVDGSHFAEMGSEYVLEKMHFDDISQLSIGEETACCQHLGGAGAASAKHSYEEPSSATYVLRKNGNVVAEAWVWRNTEDGVVIDSIEGRSSVPVPVAACAFYQMAIALIGKLCIQKVFISRTSYGLTKAVRKVLPHEEELHGTGMIVPCGYMDGKFHHLWVSAEMLNAKQSSISKE